MDSSVHNFSNAQTVSSLQFARLPTRLPELPTILADDFCAIARCDNLKRKAQNCFGVHVLILIFDALHGALW
jgi:hypothetical protein